MSNEYVKKKIKKKFREGLVPTAFRLAQKSTGSRM